MWFEALAVAGKALGGEALLGDSVEADDRVANLGHGSEVTDGGCVVKWSVANCGYRR